MQLFKHFDKLDIIEDAAFEVMFGFDDNGRLECDHSKFDSYTLQIESSFKTRSAASRKSQRNSQRNSQRTA